MADLEEEVNNMTLDGGMLHTIFDRMAQDHNFENGFGYATRFSALNRSFHAKFARLARRHRRLVVVCEREHPHKDDNTVEPVPVPVENQVQVDNAHPAHPARAYNVNPADEANGNDLEREEDENLSLDVTQASEDEDGEESPLRIELNGNRFNDLHDAAGMLRFMYFCGTELCEIDLSRFTPRALPSGCDELINAMSLFKTVESIEFGEWDSEASRCLAALIGSTHSALRRIVNVPVDGFCRFHPNLKLDFLQIHAKLLRYSYGYDWKHGDGVYVFEAAEKLEELVSSGAKCEHLAVVGFNNVRRHPTYTLLMHRFDVRRIEFINQTAEVFSDELRWFIDWHSEGTKFPHVDEVVIELDGVLRDVQDRVRVTVDLMSSVFPRCRSLEIRHNCITPITTLLHIINACQNQQRNSSLRLLLKFVLSKEESVLDQCRMLNDVGRRVTLDRCAETLTVEGTNVEVICRIE